MLRKARIALAALVIAALTAAFLGICPHVAILAKAQLLPALLALNFIAVGAIVLATILFGRIYCSVLCPLGIFQDIAGAFRKRSGKYETPWTKTRYTILILSGLAVACGAIAALALIEPYSIFGRIATALLWPVYAALRNSLVWLSQTFGWELLVAKQEVWIKSLLAFNVALASFVILGMIAAVNGRWFCNAVCPAGTLLACLSKKPLALKLRLDANACVHCGKCERLCKAHCIDQKNLLLDNARCVRCFDCVTACPKGAIRL